MHRSTRFCSSMPIRRLAVAWIALLTGMGAASPRLHGQAHVATASRQADLQIGGGFSIAKHDYEFTPPGDGTRIKGLMLYGTLDFRPHLGVEFSFRQMSTHKDDHEYERTYELGPRYVRHYGRFNPYARVAYGRGVFNFPGDVANLAYNLVAAGGGVDINVQKHVNVRVDYEYQRWFGFPIHPLQPQAGTIGAAYHF